MTGTPPAMKPARRAKEGGFSMRYGVGAVLTGWFMTFMVFCLGLSAYSGIFFASGFGWGLLPFALLFGFPVALVVGLPLAVLIASSLRKVRDQMLHVLIFALAVGAAFGIVGLISYGFEAWWAAALLAAWGAASAAIGRTCVIRMVARHN